MRGRVCYRLFTETRLSRIRYRICYVYFFQEMLSWRTYSAYRPVSQMCAHEPGLKLCRYFGPLGICKEKLTQSDRKKQPLQDTKGTSLNKIPVFKEVISSGLSALVVAPVGIEPTSSESESEILSIEIRSHYWPDRPQEHCQNRKYMEEPRGFLAGEISGQDFICGWLWRVFPSREVLESSVVPLMPASGSAHQESPPAWQ